MKKLMIILLVVMLSLGLSGVAYADTSGDQTISATIASTLTLTVPEALSGWIFSPATSNTTSASTQTAVGPHTAVVVTNSPYTLSVLASAALPDYESVADTKMTTSYDGTEVDLGAAFQLKYNTTGGDGDNNTTSTHFLNLASVTITTAETFVTATSAPANGTAYVGIEFGQTTVLGDPAYYGGSQLTYQIKLTWTASAGV